MATKRVALLILAIVVIASPFFFPSNYYYRVGSLIFVNGLAVTGMVILIGYAGQISLGHAGFAGIGWHVADYVALRHGGGTDDEVREILDSHGIVLHEVDALALDRLGNLEPAVHREVRVRQRLRLHALRRIDEQERPLAGRQRPGDLVGEVHMARGVDQVQDVLQAALRGVMQAHRVRLDRDAALALEIHRVEHLRFHLAGLQGAGELEEAIGERGLAVIDVGDDGEIPDEALIQDAFIMPAI